MEEMIWNEKPYVILAAETLNETDYRMIQEKEAFQSGTQERSLLIKQKADGTFEAEKDENIIQAFLEIQMQKMIEDQTLTLMAEDGTKEDFVVMGQALIDEKHYMALVPAATKEEPEVVVMEIVGEGEDARLNVIIDEDVICAVRDDIAAQIENALN